MKNIKTNLESFATAKLKTKRHNLLAIAFIIMAMILPGCSKKMEAQESKGSSVTGNTKTGTQKYNSESDFQIDWDDNVKDGIKILKYIGTKKEVNIPPKIQNNSVTGIGNLAFGDNKNITSVTIPDSVTVIGAGAFGGCDSLTSVTIPNSVTNIGDSAFYRCGNLTSVNIPNGVTRIGNSVFARCSSLTSVNIPDSVTSIEYYAFSNCSSLTSINIPNNVTSIGGDAFNNCKSLTSITIPASVTEIRGDNVFDNCTNLTSVTFQGKTEWIARSHLGDLWEKYLYGGPGTYKRFAGGETWKKQ